MKRFIPYVFLLLSCVLPASAYEPDSDGMYAVLNVTYYDPDTQEQVSGEIAVQLTFWQSPLTVANFVGLATGELPWFDFDSYEVRGGTENPEPYYDGLIFHRVVPNFIIQSGSRNGTGSDGPGFAIPNEIDPALNHTGGGIISMANSSTGAQRLNSGGSQFFITAAQFPETQVQLDRLNGKHSVFGFLREGQDIVQKINRSPISGTTPVNDAVIDSIDILKVGAGANDWDPSLYWVSPIFKNAEFDVGYELTDSDNDSSTPAILTLLGRFNRLNKNEYQLRETNDLEDWSITNYQRGGLAEDRILEDGVEPGSIDDNREFRFLLGDILTGPGRRSFYQLLEVELPELPDWTGRQLTINFDPIEDLDPDAVPFTPETITVDFYDRSSAGWQMKRTDSETLLPLGNIQQYSIIPVAHRDQIILDFDFFTTMQSYLQYDSPTSGTVYTYYTTPRPEGTTVTGTFSLGDADERPERQNKNLTLFELVITETPEEGDPIVATYTMNLWDNFSQESLEDSFEGGYSISRSNSEFVQTGILLYEWFEKDGDTYVLLAFDIGNELLVKLNYTSENAGTGETYFRASFNDFFPATFTTGVGEGRPNALDREGDKLVLTIDVNSTETDIIQSELNIDFYDNFEGGYESTRTDSEVNQFGDVFEYAWFESGGQTRVDLAYDTIPEMQVYLSFTSATEGTAQVHYPQFGQVAEATFVYTEGGGNDRPVRLDKTGQKLELEIGREGLGTLTMNLRSANDGDYQYTRNSSETEPIGRVLDYVWDERSDGREIATFTLEGLPTMQVQLNYSSETGGDMETLFVDNGTVQAGAFTTGPTDPERVSINKEGIKLLLDIDTNNFNATIDREEFTITGDNSGIVLRVRPDQTTTTGSIVEYQWYEEAEYDLFDVAIDNLLDQQIFLFYETPTSGTVAVFFVTSQSSTTGTFTIEQ
ncbi:MAG: peptidylprolyl isomerase [Opitutales bacterium]|nr:peptidylprolyl isomerase [Opitutales bacterium]